MGPWAPGSVALAPVGYSYGWNSAKASHRMAGSWELGTVCLGHFAFGTASL